MTAPTPNAELAYKVLDRIDAHPEQWHQNDWAYKNECGTSYCFAGWAVLLTGRELIWEDLSETYGEAAWVVDDRQADGKQWIGDAAREALGIDESYDLFRGLNTRADLGRLVAEIFGPRPVDWNKPLEPVMGVPPSGCDCSIDGGHGLSPWPDRSAPHAEDCPANRPTGEPGRIVDHGPVKPPYGTPEREAYDRERGAGS